MEEMRRDLRISVSKRLQAGVLNGLEILRFFCGEEWIHIQGFSGIEGSKA